VYKIDLCKISKLLIKDKVDIKNIFYIVKEVQKVSSQFSHA